MTKWGDDVLDAQSDEGAYPDVAPRLVVERDGAPAWADAGVIVPWVLYQRYGDRRLLERHWPHMERYLAYLLRHKPDLLWRARRNNDYGDWLSVGPDAPREVLATAYLAHDAQLMARMAAALGLDERAAAYYERLHDAVRAAWNRAYVDADGRIEGDTQTAYVLALPWTCCRRAAGRRRAAARREDRAAGDPRTGFLGIGLLCPVLTRPVTRPGIPALVQDTFPSWLYSPSGRDDDLGALGRLDRGAGSRPAMNSFNHFSLGSSASGCTTVAGIRPARPGYEEDPHRPAARSARARAGDVSLRPGRDHERLAPRRGRVRARGHDPAERDRHRRGPRRRGAERRRRGRAGRARGGAHARRLGGAGRLGVVPVPLRLGRSRDRVVADHPAVRVGGRDDRPQPAVGGLVVAPRRVDRLLDEVEVRRPGVVVGERLRARPARAHRRRRLGDDHDPDREQQELGLESPDRARGLRRAERAPPRWRSPPNSTGARAGSARRMPRARRRRAGRAAPRR